ncbi:hypothetical protein L083_3718 [Actinoplanes sp. N902-109]|nr:hypothetical protein L083_3718 [Actinoplanes sp. N902-109]
MVIVPVRSRRRWSLRRSGQGRRRRGAAPCLLASTRRDLP